MRPLERSNFDFVAPEKNNLGFVVLEGAELQKLLCICSVVDSHQRMGGFAVF